MTLPGTATSKTVFWHGELPPLEAVAIGEHTIEATSDHVPGTLTHRDEVWTACYDDLIARTHERLAQEIARLHGHCAHILKESIDTRHDDRTGEVWLHGRFTYVLYHCPPLS